MNYITQRCSNLNAKEEQSQDFLMHAADECDIGNNIGNIGGEPS